MDASSLLARFLVAKTAAGLSLRTLAWYEDQIGVYLRTGGSLDEQPIETYLARQRAAGYSPATVAARYRSLRVWCTWLARRGLIDANPFEHIARPRVPKARVRHVTGAEFRRLYESVGDGGAWPEYRDRCLMLILFWSGLRVSELVHLTAQAIDTHRRLIFVRSGKGDKDRLVPCHPGVAAQLVGYLFTRPAWDGPELWLSNDGYFGARGPLTAEGVRQMLRRRCKAAPMRHLNPHSFRHGYAMMMLNAGMDMSAVADTMGHSSVKVTEATYARWLTGPLQREYEDALRRADV